MIPYLAMTTHATGTCEFLRKYIQYLSYSFIFVHIRCAYESEKVTKLKEEVSGIYSFPNFDW